MIRFIICDDNEQASDKISKTITKSMINYPYEYEVSKFTCFNSNLNKIINTPGEKKIYILDIELPKISGLEIASKIRKKDWKSIIIFVTAHPECKNDIFYSRLLALDFISKYHLYEKRLEETINVAVNSLSDTKTLVFHNRSTTYQIPYEDIIYIEKLNGQRKCLIATRNGTSFTIRENISTLYDNLENNFYRCHKSCIVNIKEIKKVDYNEGLITFKNDLKTNLLSERMKKGLKEYIKSHQNI